MNGIERLDRARGGQPTGGASLVKSARLEGVASVRPIEDAIAPLNGVSEAALRVTISPSGALFGRLGELARASPEAFEQLLEDGAREIRAGVAVGAFRDPTRIERVAAGLSRAGSTRDLDKLDRSSFGGRIGQTADEAKVAGALQQRADAALGIRNAPPLGPWFPR